MTCASSTVIEPGTTRWNSMKSARPGLTRSDVVRLERADAVGLDDAADASFDIWAGRLIQKPGHRLDGDLVAHPEDVHRHDRGDQRIEKVPAGHSASTKPTITPTEVMTSVKRWWPSATSAGERPDVPQLIMQPGPTGVHNGRDGVERRCRDWDARALRRTQVRHRP